MGMSTLGNKLAPESAASELLVNDTTKLRVLDVPGLPDSGITSQSGRRVSAYTRRLQIFCRIVQVYKKQDLRVQRAVYFLPTRGIPEKADGSFQEELQIMHRFFGNDIFNCMVVAATNHHKYQQSRFNEEELEKSKKVLHLALKRAIGDEEIGCPPIVYIGINESEVEVMDKLKMADVLNNEVSLNLSQDFFTDGDCLRCSIKIRRNQKGEILGVVDATGTIVSYDESECHPQFVEKYARWQKILGTIAHVLALGIILLIEDIRGVEVWPPTLTSSDQVCPACRMPPGSTGCKGVNEDIDCDWIPGFAATQVRIDHEQ